MLGTIVLDTSMIDTLVLNTLILDSLGTSTSIFTIGVISIFIASPIMSTTISLLGTQEISPRTIETKPQSSIIFLGKGKEIEE